MAQYKEPEIESTVYFWFAVNDAEGDQIDGSTPVYDVRLAGAAAGAAPTLSGSATRLSHDNFPNGAHEIAIAATTANGFVVGSEYAVYCTLTVGTENPAGFVGSFKVAAEATTGTTLTTAGIAAVVQALFEGRGNTYAATAPKGSLGFVMEMLAGVNEVAITDNLDDTSSAQLHTSAGTHWGTPVVFATADPTATTPPVVIGTVDSND